MRLSHVGRELSYLVDYDLPPVSGRKKFYRAVKRYRRDHGLSETGWSTRSVVFTDDEEFAWFVYQEARRVGGVANVYEARRISAEL
ncbi:hypothetical protein ES708_17943 [subsurface metagenome]